MGLHDLTNITTKISAAKNSNRNGKANLLVAGTVVAGAECVVVTPGADVVGAEPE